jgi:uncharacterized protein (DUF362 family)
MKLGYLFHGLLREGELKMDMNIFEKLPKKEVSRKGFLKLCAVGLGSLALNSILPKFALAGGEVSNGRLAKNINTLNDLVVARGEDPYLMTVRAIEALGGMEKFVKPNSTVLIKPNIGWDRSPEEAANTNPQVVASLVELCFKAGAKRVNVFDRTCNDAKRSYANSGIEKACKDKGANVYFTDDWNVVKANFNYSSEMQDWPVYRDAIECDTFINVPVLKHHGLTGLTLSMKNLMGICGGNRGAMHINIGAKLAHITDFIKPELTVIDGYRVLVRNGPTGGNLADVINMKTVIAGKDPVLCDAYAAKLRECDPLSISYIKEASKMGLGSIDINRAKISEITV